MKSSNFAKDEENFGSANYHGSLNMNIVVSLAAWRSGCHRYFHLFVSSVIHCAPFLCRIYSRRRMDGRMDSWTVGPELEEKGGVE